MTHDMKGRVVRGPVYAHDDEPQVFMRGVLWLLADGRLRLPSRAPEWSAWDAQRRGDRVWSLRGVGALDAPEAP